MSKATLTNFFQYIKLKKNYTNTLNNQVSLLNNVKEDNLKKINIKLIKKNMLINNENKINYIISIHYLRTNTFMHVTDFAGNIKFFYSAGQFSFKGKRKVSRFNVFKSFLQILVVKLNFLKNRPVALHLINVGSNRFWIVKKLKKKIFVKTVKVFNYHPHNGCRKRKVRRKKFKIKKRRNG